MIKLLLSDLETGAISSSASSFQALLTLYHELSVFLIPLLREFTRHPHLLEYHLTNLLVAIVHEPYSISEEFD